MAASRYVKTIDHWIAFVLLLGVGIHMLYAAFQGSAATAPKGRSLAALIATAAGTSIDATAIGLATFVMSSGGMLVGRLIGNRLGKVAELVAGLVLCGLAR